MRGLAGKRGRGVFAQHRGCAFLEIAGLHGALNVLK